MPDQNSKITPNPLCRTSASTYSLICSITMSIFGHPPGDCIFAWPRESPKAPHLHNTTTHCPGTTLGVECNPKAPTALDSCIWLAIVEELVGCTPSETCNNTRLLEGFLEGSLKISASWKPQNSVRLSEFSSPKQ